MAARRHAKFRWTAAVLSSPVRLLGTNPNFPDAQVSPARLRHRSRTSVVFGLRSAGPPPPTSTQGQPRVRTDRSFRGHPCEALVPPQRDQRTV